LRSVLCFGLIVNVFDTRTTNNFLVKLGLFQFLKVGNIFQKT